LGNIDISQSKLKTILRDDDDEAVFALENRKMENDYYESGYT